MADVLDHRTRGPSPFAFNTNNSGSTEEQAQQIAGRIVPQDSNAITSLLGSVVLSPIALADIASASFGLTERGDVEDSVLSGLPGGVQNFYRDNAGVIQGVATVGEIVLTGYMAGAVLRSGTTLNKLLKGMPGGKTIAGFKNEHLRALVRVRQADRNIAASRGVAGPEAKFAEAFIPSGKKGVKLLSRNRQDLAIKSRKLGATKEAAFGVTQEIGLAAIANENDFIYTDEMGTNLFLGSIGVALPAYFGFVSTNATIKRYMVSDRMNRLASQATDRLNIEAQFLDTPLAYVDNASESIQTKGEAGYILGSHGADTDIATAQLMARKAKDVRELNPDGSINIPLEQSRNKAAIQNEKDAFQILQNVSSEGIPGVPGSSLRFTKNVPAERHIKALGHTDPTFAYGTEFIGNLKGVKSPDLYAAATFQFKQFQAEMLTQQTRAVDRIAVESAKKKPNKALIAEMESIVKRTEFYMEVEPMVARNMELVGLDDLSGLTREFTGKVKQESIGDLVIYQPEGLALGVDSAGIVILPKGAKLNKLSQYEAQGLFRAADRFIEDSVKADRFVLDVRGKANWLELDMAEAILKRNPTATVNFPAGMTREGAQIESLAQKVDAIKGLENTNQILLKERFNLPKPSAYERGTTGIDDTALDAFIKGVKNGTEVRKQSANEVRSALYTLKQSTDLVSGTADDILLSGNSFKLGQDLKGNPIESFLMFKRKLGPEAYLKETLENRLANRQADIFGTLTRDPDSAVSLLITDIVKTSGYQQAIRTSTLADSQLGTNIPGFSDAAPSTAFLNQDWVGRNNPALLAALSIQNFANKVVQKRFTDLVKAPRKPLGGRSPADVWAGLRKPTKEGSKQLLNQFISARRGWELTTESTTSEAMRGFPLKDSLHNRSRWKAIYKEDMPTGALMPLQNGNPAFLDTDAFDGLKALGIMAEHSRVENNHLLASMGFSELKNTPWYVPPISYEGKFVNFVMDSNKRVIGVIASPTEKGLKEQIRLVQSQPDSVLSLPGVTLKSQVEIQEFTTVWDRAKIGLDDANVPVYQSGKLKTNSALSPVTDFNAMDEAVNQISTQYNRIGRDSIEALFSNQLRAAKGRANIVRVNKVNQRTKQTTEVSNIHDLYINMLTGRSGLNTKQSTVGAIFGSVEAGVDKVLLTVSDFTSGVFPIARYKAKEQYNRLNKELGDKMPFDNVSDFIAAKTSAATPPSLKKLSASANRLAAGLVLRWGEIAHPILNLTGMVNTMPAVISSMTMRSGESVASFEKRIGAFASIYNIKGGKAVGALDMGKIMNRALQNAWSRKSHPDYDYMVGHGYLTQEVAEFNKALSAIHTAEGTTQFLEKADKWAGILSDKSEDFARSFSHFVGLELADNLGIKGLANRNLFAHEIANKNIANYNPLNRPEIFQGGVGGPLGLFQSYMWNYWQRMFTYVERGDMRSLATQMATQATLFGAVTVPGYRQFNDTINSITDGKTNPYDGIYNNMGQDVGDLLTAGVLSTLPKLLGADDGIALYTRGDISPRVPVLSGIPIQNIAAKFKGGISAGIDAFMDDVPGISAQEVAEILSNSLVNRPLSSLLDLYAGADTDMAGNVVSDQVRTTMGMASRLLGLKTLSEQKSAEAFYSNKTQMSIQLAKRQRLNRAARSNMRAGNFDKIPDIYVGYLNSGGDPRNVGNYIKELMRSSTTTRSDRQLMGTLNSPTKTNQMIRQLNARK